MGQLKKEMNRLCSCGIAVGVVFLLFGGYLGLKARAASSWPTVEGKILSSVVGEHPGCHADTETWASIGYVYRINGQTFRGNVFDSNQSLTHQHPKGSRVTVHYDPSNPSNAVILIKTNRAMAFLWFGVVFCIASPVLTRLIAREFPTNANAPNDAELEDEIQAWKQEQGFPV